MTPKQVSQLKKNGQVNNYARENAIVPIQQVLTRIKVRPGESSSPEIQGMQFLAWACNAHKVKKD